MQLGMSQHSSHLTLHTQQGCRVTRRSCGLSFKGMRHEFIHCHSALSALSASPTLRHSAVLLSDEASSVSLVRVTRLPHLSVSLVCITCLPHSLLQGCFDRLQQLLASLAYICPPSRPVVTPLLTAPVYAAEQLYLILGATISFLLFLLPSCQQRCSDHSLQLRCFSMHLRQALPAPIADQSQHNHLPSQVREAQLH